jgi:dTDP-4-dehydrorhamnose reductase
MIWAIFYLRVLGYLIVSKNRMNANQKKVVLVFGGSGLLGVHCHQVLKQNYKVVLTYNTNPILLDTSVSFNALDNTDVLDKMLEEYQPDIIINALALVTVDGCESDPNLAKNLNEDFVKNLVLSMKKNNLTQTHLIQISSDSVYGQQKNRKIRPWVETDQLNPMSVYAKTKLKSEIEAKRHSGPVSVIRTAFYGINPYSSKSLLWWIINNAQNNNEMDGWENIYFSPISATRLVKIIQIMIEKSLSGVFNIGSNDSCNKFDFVEAVCKNIGHPVKINRISNTLIKGAIIRPEYSVLDTKKFFMLIPMELHWRDDLNSYLINSLPFPSSS